MCYDVCRGGWLNQWNNSITLGNCTIWVLNISLVYLNPTFVRLQTAPACHILFPLIQLQNAYYCHTSEYIYFMRPVAAHLSQFTFKNAGQCMCYDVCRGGWLNQWNNSITLGNCTIWVLNISLVYLNPTFVRLQTAPARHIWFPLIQLQNAYYCHTFEYIYFMRPVAAHLSQFTFKNAGQCMCYGVCRGGWLNQWNNSITLGNCTIWVLNISLVYLNPTFVRLQTAPACHI